MVMPELVEKAWDLALDAAANIEHTCALYGFDSDEADRARSIYERRMHEYQEVTASCLALSKMVK
jgi:hypothetical protein